MSLGHDHPDPAPISVADLLDAHFPVHRRQLRAGDALFHRGDPGDAAQVVRSGIIGMEVAGGHREPVVAWLARPGDVVAGERLLLPATCHEATGRALVDSEVQLLWRADLVAHGLFDDVCAVLTCDVGGGVG